MSGTGKSEADSSNVFRPVTVLAEPALVQAKLNCTSVDAIGAVGVKANT